MGGLGTQEALWLRLLQFSANALVGRHQKNLSRQYDKAFLRQSGSVCPSFCPVYWFTHRPAIPLKIRLQPSNPRYKSFWWMSSYSTVTVSRSSSCRVTASRYSKTVSRKPSLRLKSIEANHLRRWPNAESCLRICTVMRRSDRRPEPSMFCCWTDSIPRQANRMVSGSKL